MPKTKPVVVAGVEYASRRDAAKAFGISESTVQKRLRLGWTLEQAVATEVTTQGKDKLTPEDALKRYVATTSGCWEWARSVGASGYGAWPLVNRDGITSCHRAAYHYLVGPIPKGLHVRHKCDNKLCVNPDHLELGTSRDNMRDKVERGRQPRGEGHGRATLTTREVVLAREFCIRFPPKPGSRGMAGSLSFLARWFGVSLGAVSLAVRHKSWQHVA